jgi:excisionase family DNA binding protein
MSKMVSIAAAADHYGVSRQTVRRWIASGKITAYRVEPRLIRVDLEEIETKIIHAVPIVNVSHDQRGCGREDHDLSRHSRTK